MGMEAALTFQDAIITAYRDHAWHLTRGGTITVRRPPFPFPYPVLFHTRHTMLFWGGMILLRIRIVMRHTLRGAFID